MKRLLIITGLGACLLLSGCAPLPSEAEALILERYPKAELRYDRTLWASIVYYVRTPQGCVYRVSVVDMKKIESVEIFHSK